MDESRASSVVPEMDIRALNEALYAQQQLLQKLYTELDVEREASSTAASEALSMILRLQGEKASLKMEASQYKRMSEEEICHAEEALAVFEDLIYQREMEIASLEYQVQAYRYKLLSMGCDDLGVYENKFPENLLMQRNDHLFGVNGANSNVKRLNSLPPEVHLKDSNHKKSTIDSERSTTPEPDSIPSTVAENSNGEVNDSQRKPGNSTSGDINYYWEQIKKLDERVKEISDSKNSVRNKSALSKGGTWSPSLFSHVGIGTSGDATKEVNVTDSDQVKHHGNSQERVSVADTVSSPSIQDIFEVPQTTERSKASRTQATECQQLTLEDENRLCKPDSVSEDILESPEKDEKDNVKTTVLSAIHEKKLPKPRDKIRPPRSLSPVCPPIGSGSSQAEYQLLSQRIERLERETNDARRQIIAEREEELNLLKEMREQLKSIQSERNDRGHEIIAEGEGELNMWREICNQLKSIQSEMRCLRTEKSQLPHQPSLDPLQEAMLYFWL